MKQKAIQDRQKLMFLTESSSHRMLFFISTDFTYFAINLPIDIGLFAPNFIFIQKA